MMDVRVPDYIIADPNGNITILVTEKVSEAQQAELGAELLRLEKTAEQVGFVSVGPEGEFVRLRMAGGEFCGNASLSAAAYALASAGKRQGMVQVLVSGQEKPLEAELGLQQDSVWSGTLEMPLPEGKERVKLCFEERTFSLPLVRLPGIAHLIISEPWEPSDAEHAVRQWCAELKLPALGMIFLSENGEKLTPLVYVASVDSLYWEGSCASGTCAAAVWLAENEETPRKFFFREPGGTLGAEAGKGMLRLLGRVRFCEPSRCE